MSTVKVLNELEYSDSFLAGAGTDVTTYPKVLVSKTNCKPTCHLPGRTPSLHPSFLYFLLQKALMRKDGKWQHS